MKKSDLINIAEELNEVMGCNPPINVKGSLKIITDDIKEAVNDCLAPTDTFSKETVRGLGELITIEDVSKQEVLEALRKLGIWLNKDEGDSDDGAEEPPEEGEGPVNLEFEIRDATKLRQLKDLAKTYDQFKQLRGELTKHKTVDALRQVMLLAIGQKAENPPVKEPPVTKEQKKETTKRTGSKSSTKEKVDFLTPLVKQGKFNRKELVEKALKKFPDASTGSIQTILTDGKNPKYNKFDKLIVQNDDGTVKFKK